MSSWVRAINVRAGRNFGLPQWPHRVKLNLPRLHVWGATWFEPAGFISTYNGEQHKTNPADGSLWMFHFNLQWRATQNPNPADGGLWKSHSNLQWRATQNPNNTDGSLWKISLLPTAVASVRTRMPQTASAPWAGVNNPPTEVGGLARLCSRRGPECPNSSPQT
jgi:hypothetical protein